MLRNALILIIAVLSADMSHASGTHRRLHPAVWDANGNAAHVLTTIRSKETGATARVDSRYAAEFQSYIDDLEAHGAVIRFMGGFRRGHCASASLHPCGRALDVCQLARGRVDSRCHLPRSAALAAIASRHGLFEGGRWCNSDYGHAQVGVTAAACSSSHTASAKRRLLAGGRATPRIGQAHADLR
jgi:hypothetical protein